MQLSYVKPYFPHIVTSISQLIGSHTLVVKLQFSTKCYQHIFKWRTNAFTVKQIFSTLPSRWFQLRPTPSLEVSVMRWLLLLCLQLGAEWWTVTSCVMGYDRSRTMVSLTCHLVNLTCQLADVTWQTGSSKTFTLDPYVCTLIFLGHQEWHNGFAACFMLTALWLVTLMF